MRGVQFPRFPREQTALPPQGAAMPEPDTVTRLLLDWNRGNQAALDQLASRVAAASPLRVVCRRR
jgi:hypothetical protein